MTGGWSLLPLFLLACAGGYLVARPVADTSFSVWRRGVESLSPVLLVGAVIAAAESGSAVARYLALLAVLCAGAAAVMILGSAERASPPPPDDRERGETE